MHFKGKSSKYVNTEFFLQIIALYFPLFRNSAIASSNKYYCLVVLSENYILIIFIVLFRSWWKRAAHDPKQTNIY